MKQQLCFNIPYIVLKVHAKQQKRTLYEEKHPYRFLCKEVLGRRFLIDKVKLHYLSETHDDIATTISCLHHSFVSLKIPPRSDRPTNTRAGATSSTALAYKEEDTLRISQQHAPNLRLNLLAVFLHTFF